MKSDPSARHHVLMGISSVLFYFLNEALVCQQLGIVFTEYMSGINQCSKVDRRICNRSPLWNKRKSIPVTILSTSIWRIEGYYDQCELVLKFSIDLIPLFPLS